MSNKFNELMSFDGNNVDVIELDGEFLFELYSVGMALGYTKVAKNKIYAQKDRIDKVVKNAEISTVVHNVQQYLTEEMLYDFMLEAKTDKCKPFRKWITHELLPELRKSGAVILDNATKETVDFKFKYGVYRIRKTFKNSNNILADYEEYKTLSANEWKSKRLNNDDRIKLSKLIKKGIEDKVRVNMMSMKPSELLSCQELLTNIQEDITKLENNKRGGKLAAATKEIKKLESELEVVKTKADYIENYNTIDLHGFSVNYQYEYSHTYGNLVKSYAYKKWIENFTNKYELAQLPGKDDHEIFDDIDFSRPIHISIKYIAKAEADIENFNKSFIDMLFNRILGVDDNIVHSISSERIGTCNTYDDGSISWYIRNID